MFYNTASHYTKKMEFGKTFTVKIHASPVASLLNR